MSSREPLWFCHQCNAEMRPLMVPDPVCASCRGAFVEKMENPQDDPREFHQHGEGIDELPEGLDPVMMMLHTLLNQRPRRPASPGTERTSGLSFQFQSTGPSGTRSISIGGPNTFGGTARTRTPTMSEFARRDPGQDGGITGPLMAQYLMALLGRAPLNDLFPGGLDGDPAERGRMGDYVFSQEALDGIITQLMENSNATRPVPATEDIVKNLPREILEEGSATLEKDCAVCKEQFKTETDDPDEQVVVTLPCKHPFHEPCILPWLKSSGTCPVCRHALVPQPEAHPAGSPGGSGSGGGGSPPNNNRPPHRRSSSDGSGSEGGGGGIFQSLLGLMAGSGSGSGGSGPNNGQQSRSSPTSPRPTDNTNRRQHQDRHIPGRWEDEVE